MDLVYVATEPSLHAEVAVKALTSGKHCVCQKPPSISQSEAEKMVNLSRYYSQLLSLLESHLRFLPAVARAKELIAEGHCGRVLAIEVHVAMGSLVDGEPYGWKCDAAMGGGALNIVGPHIVDLVSFLSGQHAERVHGMATTFRAQTERIHGYRTITSDDFCSFQLQCSGGVFATCNINTHLPGKYEFSVSVTGSEARLTVRGMDLYSCKNSAPETLLFKQERVDLPSLGLSPSSSSSSSLLSPDYFKPIYVGCREMFSALQKAYAVSAERSPLAPQSADGSAPLSLVPAARFEDGIYIRTVLDALATSQSTGRWVDIPKTDFVEATNPFWTSSATRLTNDKPSPKPHRPIFV